MTAAADQPHIGLIVEGQGDAGALPVLLRTHLAISDDYRDILGKPIPVHGREKATRAGGLEGFVATAAARPGCKSLVVVLDGEGDDVALLGPQLLSRASSATGLPVHLTLADQNFESWIFASAETLELGLTYNASVSGGGAIVSALKPGKYVKPTHQPRLAARMDTALARSRSASLEHLLVGFDRLLAGF